MRAIDGDKLIEFFFDLCGGNDSTSVKAGIAAIVTVIQAAQLAVTIDDLRPKGRWNPLPEDDREQMVGDQCSLCGYEHFGSRFNFCPSCGAKMVSGEADG